jgi:hypothetical protein
MKTKLVTLLGISALALFAAAYRPTLSFDGCFGGVYSNPLGCTQAQLTVTGADPNQQYVVLGTNGTTESTDFGGPFYTDSTGMIQLNSASLDLGSWTFELHTIGNKGTPMNHAIDSVGVSFVCTVDGCSIQ